jgi:hypothetical protein
VEASAGNRKYRILAPETFHFYFSEITIPERWSQRRRENLTDEASSLAAADDEVLDMAARSFEMALRINPSMVEAKEALDSNRNATRHHI